jgi:hypothetical protein
MISSLTLSISLVGLVYQATASFTIFQVPQNPVMYYACPDSRGPCGCISDSVDNGNATILSFKSQPLDALKTNFTVDGLCGSGLVDFYVHQYSDNLGIVSADGTVDGGDGTQVAACSSFTTSSDTCTIDFAPVTWYGTYICGGICH